MKMIIKKFKYDLKKLVWSETQKLYNFNRVRLVEYLRIFSKPEVCSFLM